MRIRRVNPIAKAVARNRPRTQVIPSKKGKGSYNRKKGREDAVSVTISKDAYNKINNTET